MCCARWPCCDRDIPRCVTRSSARALSAPALEGLAARLGVADRVDFHGQLDPEAAVEQARRCTLFVMPSTDEAFGVAYIEAMAAGVPAIGCRGEPGPGRSGGGGGRVRPGRAAR